VIPLRNHDQPGARESLGQLVQADAGLDANARVGSRERAELPLLRRADDAQLGARRAYRAERPHEIRQTLVTPRRTHEHHQRTWREADSQARRLGPRVRDADAAQAPLEEGGGQ
jgi:hypothetical protein